MSTQSTTYASEHDGEVEETERLLEAFLLDRDPAARAALIAACVPLVERLAWRFVRRGEPYEDLVQAGSIGLIKAVDRFDATKGSPFGAYANAMVLGELRRHLRDRTWSIRPPRRVQERCLELHNVAPELTQRLGHTPSTRELAGACGTSESELSEALLASHGYRSLALDGPGERGDLDGRVGCQDDSFEDAELRTLLEGPFAGLSALERRVLQLRYVGQLTQDEIAKAVGVSQMKISRLLRRTSAQLAKALLDEAT